MNHKTIFILTLVLVAALGFGVLRATSQDAPADIQATQADVGTAFTYQGHLNDGSSPANGSYDFEFTLWDSLSGGNRLGSTASQTLSVSNGLFSTSLDFGAHFAGETRYLQIRVKPTTSGEIVLLTPRQELTAAPYALSLPNVKTIADGSVVIDATDSAAGESDIDLHSNDAVHVSLNHDGTPGSDSDFIVLHGSTILFNVDESGITHVFGQLQVEANDNATADLVLSGNSNTDDDGIIASDPSYSGSDLVLNSHDAVTVNLNSDGTSGEDSDFEIKNGSNVIFNVDEGGQTTVEVLQIDGGADLSEWFDVREGDVAIASGMVVCIDPDNPGALIVCTEEYAMTVAGAISGAGGVNTGMTMGQSGSIADGDHPVALTGRIYVWADASYGAIQPGHLLTTSNTPGHVMVATDHSRAHGTIIGKAMTPLDSGTGLILVLINLQ